MITEPMLAGKVSDVNKLAYPLIASPKLDGIRLLKLAGRALARSLKPIPNEHIREVIERLAPDGIDGETMSGSNFQEATSGVMRQTGKSPFALCAFDLVKGDLRTPYRERLQHLEEAVAALGEQNYIKAVPTLEVHTPEELLAFEEKVLGYGFEGAMVRAPNGPYKCGRSTEREGWLLKLKRFEDSEAEVLGFVEMLHNGNEAKVNELGRTARSSAKAGKVGKGTLGKFLCRDLKTGVEFRLGTGRGLDWKLRQHIWDNRPSFLGKIVKYEYQVVGVKNKPRCPVWVGFRDRLDL